ncbi:MAG TPA: hypothetical protein VIH73_06780, partial [Acidimicrobiales bacterium]
MTLNDSLRRCEPDADSRKFDDRVKPTERHKELVGVGHVESRARVAHEKDAFAVHLGRAHVDAGRSGIRRELPRILEEDLEKHST